jgi:hypothetical protein
LDERDFAEFYAWSNAECLRAWVEPFAPKAAAVEIV